MKVPPSIISTPSIYLWDGCTVTRTWSSRPQRKRSWVTMCLVDCRVSVPFDSVQVVWCFCATERIQRSTNRSTPLCMWLLSRASFDRAKTHFHLMGDTLHDHIPFSHYFLHLRKKPGLSVKIYNVIIYPHSCPAPSRNPIVNQQHSDHRRSNVILTVTEETLT